jgi:hypothetical protein
VKYIKVISALLFLIPLYAISKDRSGSMPSYLYTVKVDVDTDGRLVNIKPTRAIEEPYAGLLKQTLAKWRFYPARVDGKPAVTTTWLKLELKAAKQSNGDVQIHLAYLGNGPDYQLTPKYPPDMIGQGLGAKIFLHATIGVDGKFSEVSVTQALVTNGRHADEFVRSSIDAAQAATAEPIVVAGKPVISHVSLPIVYRLSERGGNLQPAGDSAKYVSAPSKEVVKVQSEDDALLALDSPIRPMDTDGE